MVVIESGGARFYMDNHLSRQLKRVKDSMAADDDYIVAICGPERSGKSVFGMQCCKAVDPNFSLSQVAWNAEQFEKICTTSDRRKAVLYDEAFSGLSSRSTLSGVNKQLVSLMSEMGQRNLFVVIILPSWFLLDWYAAVHRCRGMFFVYRRKGKRGFWRFYNRRKKDMIYELPRHLRQKKMPRPSFFGRFLEQYALPEKEYRRLKAKHFRERENDDKKPLRYKNDRDRLIFALHDHLGMSEKALAEFCEAYSVGVKRAQIGNVLREQRPKR